MNKNLLKNAFRHDVIKLLKSNSGNKGVELGVAKGVFSSRMVCSGYFSNFIGIDRYSDRHDFVEYKEALSRTGIFSNYKLLKMTFDDAFDLFPDESLDFIYIDGYAHNGEQGGKTIFEWSKKVKIGGVISGDDYHPDWPLVIEAVDEFVKQTGFDMHMTTEVEEDPYSLYPSWAVIKENSTGHLSIPPELVARGLAAKRPRRKLTVYLKVLLSKILPKILLEYIKSKRK